MCLDIPKNGLDTVILQVADGIDRILILLKISIGLVRSSIAASVISFSVSPSECYCIANIDGRYALANCGV